MALENGKRKMQIEISFWEKDTFPAKFINKLIFKCSRLLFMVGLSKYSLKTIVTDGRLILW